MSYEYAVERALELKSENDRLLLETIFGIYVVLILICIGMAIKTEHDQMAKEEVDGE